MNVFDFDRTIYNGDSSIDFWIFCLKKDFRLLRYFPNQMMGLILYKLKKIPKEDFKSMYFSFFSGIVHIDSLVVDFWNSREKKIKEWYKNIHKEDDCIISASPEFLLQEICKRLKINNLIATKVNKHTGKLESLNCYGINKILFWKEQFCNQSIDFFYSDSKSDIPMANISKKAFLIKKNKINTWR